MPALDISVSSTAQIICLFPGAPDAAHAAFRVEDRMNLTAAELRAVREAVIKLPVPWFEACEQQTADDACDRRWTCAYVKQTTGPFIANFTITGSGAAFAVCLDDGEKLVDEWDDFATIADAVAVIGYYVEWVLTGWGLKVA